MIIRAMSRRFSYTSLSYTQLFKDEAWVEPSRVQRWRRFTLTIRSCSI